MAYELDEKSRMNPVIVSGRLSGIRDRVEALYRYEVPASIAEDPKSREMLGETIEMLQGLQNGVGALDMRRALLEEITKQQQDD